ncbi:nucleotidyltransferase [Mucilaginibacter roseus]|uniref:Nucleotidyltransferase n=1 Tax=Mucilaginibacter roseus TaxID=1528868 RepID=A0ABS8TZ84_9SPHI|nr:nucleotidyltransferase [Mucilaginibacter roseus]MCD8739702.1 nucleotidyltransferase [Mucilaginibacter roseus]
MATDRSKHLNDVLTTHKISKEQALLDKHKSKRDDIVTALNEEYGTDIYSPFNSGSYAKNTAVNKKFDFDLMAPFKRNAFSTLKEMYESVYDFLNEKYQGTAYVRRQKVSIGIEFYADGDGHVIKIDVVPGRELNKDQYPEDRKLNLYVYSQFGKIAEGSDYIRTNVSAQVSNIRDNANRNDLRKIIRLLKVWKIHNNKVPKSFFIELIVIKAFDKKNVSGSLWDMLKIVLEYIRDNVKTVSLSDPGNTGNEVADSLSDWDKTVMSDDMANIVKRVDENSDNIKLYFPLNDKFPLNDQKNSYGGGGFSVPPVTRFG